MPDDSASEETTLTKWHRQGRNLYRALGIIFSNSEVWQRGLSQNPAKIPCRVIGTVGSNPTTSTMVNLSPSEKESLGSSQSLRQVFRSRE